MFENFLSLKTNKELLEIQKRLGPEKLERLQKLSIDIFDKICRDDIDHDEFAILVANIGMVLLEKIGNSNAPISNGKLIEELPKYFEYLLEGTLQHFLLRLELFGEHERSDCLNTKAIALYANVFGDSCLNNIMAENMDPNLKSDNTH